MTRYLTYDVFTNTRFGGNPLAIIPDASTLPESDLARIAREFNYSETVFLYPPDDPAHTARARIFTPTMEVPFAGHPTIGMAVALAETGAGPDMTLELGIGPVSAHAVGGQARFDVDRPFEVLSRPAPDLVARCLGLPETALAGAPVQGGVGLDFVLVELVDRAALAACRPSPDGFQEAALSYPAGLDFAIYAWWRDGETLHARMFAPLDDIIEDPATGSAAAALGARLAETEGREITLTVHQGDDMGRPSRIGVIARPGGAITISGRAIRMMEGRLV